MKQKVGIYGGSFDPIHTAHLEVARTAQNEFGLDLVLFVPCGNPPHKTVEVSAEHRFMMVEEAIKDDLCFWTSRIEVEREGPSYTVDTLKAMKALYPDDELYLIMGSDEANVFDTWKQAETVLKLATPIVAHRPGSMIDYVKLGQNLSQEAVRSLNDGRLKGVFVTGTSSTAIRTSLFSEKDPRDIYSIPPAVAEYIVDHDLYRSDDHPKRIFSEVKLAAERYLAHQKHTPCAALIMMMGLPRSGKSTIVEQLRKELGATVVSPDSVRLAMHGQRYIEEAEPWTWAMVVTMVRALFMANNDVVILDATNLTRDRRRDWQATDLWDTYFYYVDTPVPICVRRAVADGMEDLVPVIKRMAEGSQPLNEVESKYLLNRRVEGEEETVGVGSSDGRGASTGS